MPTLAPPLFADTITITRGFAIADSPMSGRVPPFGFELFGKDTAITGETFTILIGGADRFAAV